MIFKARHFSFTFPRPALVMGIVNVTPDSFSDGGKFFSTTTAVEHALQLVAQGAEILDIGGESTRPHAAPVDEAEELRRVIPVIKQLAAQVKIPLSIDTMKPAVARAALQAGASIINDVGANRPDNSDMWRVVAESGAGYAMMHMQGTPQTMSANPVYEDVVQAVMDFFRLNLIRLSESGVKNDQVMLDVGIGFGKTLEHNLSLFSALREYHVFGRPLLLGASRKSFIEKLLGNVSSRLPASLACASIAVASGVQVVRAHDVAETVQAIRMTEAMLQRKPAGNQKE